MGKRDEWLLEGLTRDAALLEIGPGNAPVAPRRAGWNTLIVDHLSKAGLLAKYGHGADAAPAFEDVDFVIEDQSSILETVPAAHHGAFEAVIASHVFEHLPDPVRFLQTCDRLLSPGGSLRMAVPDKRLCFDYFRPLTSTGDLLAAYHNRDRVHSIKTTFDAVAYALTQNGQIAWAEMAYAEPAIVNDLGLADACVQRARAAPAYHDFHAWVFTPSSFELLLLELNLLGLTALDLAETRMQGGSEFLVRLQRRGMSAEDPSARERRLRLLERTAVELAAQGQAVASARHEGDTPTSG